MSAVFADLMNDIADVVTDYRALEVPTVLRMRQASNTGEHSLFSSRLRRMTAHAGQAKQRQQQLANQPMDELASRDLRVQAQRAMEVGYRLLEVSSSDLAVSTVTRIANELRIGVRSVGRSLAEEATPAAPGATALLSKTDLLAGLDGLATDAVGIARRYSETYADLMTGRNLVPASREVEIEAEAPR